ncbi:MAG: glycosyltransferase family 9 protein, partial [Candidatus Omnitrophica bacterium]|nr:glycosyltransferase family 9 protein [Candidatus Omnitrophota bacterium]
MAVNDKVKKIIFITSSNIGDAVLTLPSLDYLKDKFKDAEFTVVSSPRVSVLFSSDPRIKENIPYDKHIPLRKKIALFNRLRREKFDVIVDLRDTAFRWVAEAKFKNPYIARIPKDIRHLRLRHLYKTKSALKDDVSVTKINIPRLSLHSDNSTKENTEKLLKQYNLSLNSDYIVVSAGALSYTKRWHKEGFAKICEQLLKQYSVILLGDKNDCDVHRDINSRLGNRCVDLTGKTSLLEAIAILNRAKLIIGNDSAISHL